MSKKPPDISKITELHKTTFADILNMFGQGKIRIEPHTQILDRLSRAERTTQDGRFIYLFGVLCRFQHCTGHITTGSWKGRGNQYIQFVRVLYCKLPNNGKQLPAFPLQAILGTKPWSQRWPLQDVRWKICFPFVPLSF